MNVVILVHVKWKISEVGYANIDIKRFRSSIEIFWTEIEYFLYVMQIRKVYVI